MPGSPVVPEVRPLIGPALGTVIALTAMAAHLLPRLPRSWTAYRVLAANAESGVPSDEIPGVLYAAAQLDLPFVVGAIIPFGCALAFLTTWVLRARRNAAKLAPHYLFRFSPVLAVAGFLAPVGNLWLAGPVLAEIADASRPPTSRPRPVLDRAWWLCMLAAALGLAAAAAAAQWTPLGSASRGESPSWELPPTPAELSAQLAVAGFQTVAAVGFVAGIAFLIVTMVRIGRWQARTTHAASSHVIDEPSGTQRPALVRVTVGCAAIAAALLAVMVVIHCVGLDFYGWEFTGLTGQFFFIFILPLLALNIGQVVALCVAAVRFCRQPHHSAMGLTVVASVVAWLRLFPGPPGPLPEELGIDLTVVNWVAAFACTVTVFMSERASRPDRH